MKATSLQRSTGEVIRMAAQDVVETRQQDGPTKLAAAIASCRPKAMA
jgi:hypothetical protein